MSSEIPGGDLRIPRNVGLRVSQNWQTQPPHHQGKLDRQAWKTGKREKRKTKAVPGSNESWLPQGMWGGCRGTHLGTYVLPVAPPARSRQGVFSRPDRRCAHHWWPTRPPLCCYKLTVIPTSLPSKTTGNLTCSNHNQTQQRNASSILCTHCSHVQPFTSPSCYIAASLASAGAGEAHPVLDLVPAGGKPWETAKSRFTAQSSQKIRSYTPAPGPGALTVEAYGGSVYRTQ